ncbi:hypothetical protein FRAHR75_1390008 [Frankia sp. Hr75.2]|nr:hypothetical protein FRAHR75_1390008 [Frankia sp. Hr75.2]
MRAESKRREANRLGWSVQWATARMVGTFLTDPAGGARGGRGVHGRAGRGGGPGLSEGLPGPVADPA